MKGIKAMGDNFLVWMRRFNAAISSNGVQYAVPFLFITLACHAWFHGTIYYFDVRTLPWWIERHPPLAEWDWANACLRSFPDKIQVCGRIITQLDLAESRAAHHFWVMRFFQIRYFSFLSTAFAAATFLAPFAILLAKAGWDGMWAGSRSAMLGLACNAAFFGSFPSWTRMEDNIAENRKLYVSHSNLVEDIRTYILTQGTNEKCRKERAIGSAPQEVFLKGDFFHVREVCLPTVYTLLIDRDLAAMNVVYLEADSSQIRNGGYSFEQLLELTNNPSAETTTPIKEEKPTPP